MRILIDGYNLLHAWERYQGFRDNQSYRLIHTWPELAPGRPRHSAAARAELIHILTQYQDAVGTPLTIFFDGSGAPPGVPKDESSGRVEVLFSKAGQTADDLIERATHRFQPYGEVLVVTDDNAERNTVVGFGGLAASCQSFIVSVENALAAFTSDLKNYNRTERHRFNQRR